MIKEWTIMDTISMRIKTPLMTWIEDSEDRSISYFKEGMEGLYLFLYSWMPPETL